MIFNLSFMVQYFEIVTKRKNCQIFHLGSVKIILEGFPFTLKSIFYSTDKHNYVVALKVDQLLLYPLAHFHVSNFHVTFIERTFERVFNIPINLNDTFFSRDSIFKVFLFFMKKYMPKLKMFLWLTVNCVPNCHHQATNHR